MKKQSTNDEKIITAMDALDKSVRDLQKFGTKYNDYIDEAAIRGDDARAINSSNKRFAHLRFPNNSKR